MFKKTITFEDLDGNSLTEDFYFHMSEAELVELEVSSGKDGFDDHVKRIVAASDGRAIMKEVKAIFSMAYGKRSEDGRRFIKSPELSEEFLQTDAYSVLFMELFADEKAMSDFVNALVPASLAKKVAELAKTQETQTSLEKGTDAVVEAPLPEATTDREILLKPEDLPGPAYIRENRDPTQKELERMSKEEMQVAFARKLSS